MVSIEAVVASGDLRELYERKRWVVRKWVPKMVSAARSITCRLCLPSNSSNSYLQPRPKELMFSSMILTSIIRCQMVHHFVEHHHKLSKLFSKLPRIRDNSVGRGLRSG